MKGHRYKPVGWRGESHRHYLASKGISTVIRKNNRHLRDNWGFGKYSKWRISELYVDKRDGSIVAINPLAPLGWKKGDESKGGEAISQEKIDRIRDNIVLVKTKNQSNYFFEKGKKNDFNKLFAHRSKSGKQMIVRGVPISAKQLLPGTIYPVTPAEVKKILERMPKEDLRGLRGIEFVQPTGEQKKAWGQYVRSRKTILLFSQKVNNGNIDGQPVENVRKLIKEYVIPHEMGHFKALSQHNITDADLALAEARADANVVGMAPNDRDVRTLKR